MSHSTSGQSRCPLKAETGVQFSDGIPMAPPIDGTRSTKSRSQERYLMGLPTARADGFSHAAPNGVCHVRLMTWAPRG